ncbi:angio-associated migratory cell protein isoform X2 [Odontomachus brunneus]|uniref:angio-associated migratory cell protein isoform X2 n=1 Tax=Odontomachus brunneus TaxID=486640 RepID=UPI0013F1BEB7|nr:angio-associated migratory cell protein isoform X2 [Odontomachus brunneus]
MMDGEEEISDFLSEGEIDEIIDLSMETDDDSEDSMDLIDPITSVTSMGTMQQESIENAVCVFKGHARSNPIYCACLSQNGELAITGSGEDVAYLWETTTGNIVMKCDGHIDSVIFAEFSHDETYLATADMKGLIQLWELSSKTCYWQNNIGDLFWIKWHHSANILLASCESGEIYMWSLPKGKCKIFPGYGSVAECGTICPDGKSIVVGYRDGTIRMINLKDSTVTATIPISQGHTSLITSIDCDVNNKLLISVSTDGKTILSTAHNGKIISILQDLSSGTSTEQNDCTEEEESESNTKNWAETIAFCKDPTLPCAASGTVNGELFIWDISKQILRHNINIYTKRAITKVLWKGNTSILFLGGADGVTRCVDAKTGECLRFYKGHKGAILDLYISKNEKRLLTVSEDATAIVFDISSIS